MMQAGYTRLLTIALAFGTSISLGSFCAAQEMQYPLAVAKANDVIYVADRNLPGVWKIEGGQASVFFQASKKFRTPLNAVRCLAVDSQGVLYAGDSSTREVYKFDQAGQPQPLTKGEIGIPMGIVIDSKGNLFVSDLERHVIFQVSASGEVSEFVKTPAPRGLAIDKQDRIWVLAGTGDAIVRYAPDKSKEVLVSGSPFEFPNQLTVDDKDNAYLCDGYAKSVIKVAPKAEPQKLVEGEPLKNPVGIVLVGDQLLVADPHVKAIFSMNLADSKLERVFPK